MSMPIETQGVQVTPLAQETPAATLLMKTPIVTEVVDSEEMLTLYNNVPTSHDDIFLRDVLLSTTTISSADTIFGEVLGSTIYDPMLKYLTSPYISSRIQGFRYLCAGLKITARMTAPGSCYGMYNLQALCEGGVVPPPGTFYTLDGITLDSALSSVNDTFVFMNCEDRNTAVLELPFESAQTAMDLTTVSSNPAQWRLLFWCFCPLLSTIAATASGTVQIYASLLPGYKFSQLSYQGKEREQMPVAKDGAPRWSSVEGSVKGGFSSIPVIGRMAKPISTGLAVAADIASFFGFTREAAPRTPTPMITRMFSSPAYVDGEDTGEVVALFPSNATTIDPSAGGGSLEDPCSFASLLARWHVIGSVLVGTTSSGVVSSFPVTPLFIPTDLNGSQVPSPCAFVAFPFERWRGDMEYLIYIPSSTNFQGALQVLWDPQVGSPTYAADPTHRLKNVVIDLNGSSRTIVRICYAAPTATLYSRPMGSFAPANSTNTNGTLVLRVLASLVAPQSGSTVNVIVMARCRNLEIGVPRDFYGPVGSPFKVTAAYFQGMEEADEIVDLNEPCQTDYPVVDVNYGERIESVRPFFQKFSPLYCGLPGAANAAIPYLHYLWPSSAVFGTRQWAGGGLPSNQGPWLWWSYFAMMFAGVRGSMRYKFIPSDYSNTVVTASPQTFFGLGASSPIITTALPPFQHFDMQMVGEANGGGEFTLPTYGPDKYVNVRNLVDLALGVAGSRVNCFISYDSLSSPTAVRQNSLMAAGSDFTVTRFRRMPAMAIGF